MNSYNMMGSHKQITCANRVLDLSGGAKIMGILNTTPDSFYDGGALQGDAGHVDIDRSLDHALAMLRDGASIIDIGGESSRPGAEKISAAAEIERTVPLIARLRQCSDVLISIDTYKAEVAAEALKAGADMVNDISGFTFDPELPLVCRKYQAAVVLMHTPVMPGLMQWSTLTNSGADDIIARVSRFLANSIALAEHHSIENIIIDPGFGFGKSVAENFQLLRHMNSLCELGRPVLVGLSRKSFLGHAITAPGEETPPPAERLSATIAAETIALIQGTSILRVHDVQAAMQCLRVVESIRELRPSNPHRSDVSFKN
ncbi:MAG: dihydropteroate synthase [Chlorobium sp.]|nr:MAG: dihydropteroate synthase [Chlorobium sp.]